MTCPSCQSEQTRRLSVVYEEGLSSVSANTQGFALGSGGSAWGTSRTEGVSQTALSQKAAPPKKQSVIKLALMSVVGLFVWSIIVNLIAPPGILSAVLMLGYIAVAIFIVYRTSLFNKTKFPALYEQWERGYMCMQCGSVFGS
ncbi:MAG: hypothetical protein ACLFP4_06905 [Spirochaetales bacterium]